MVASPTPASDTSSGRFGPRPGRRRANDGRAVMALAPRRRARRLCAYRRAGEQSLPHGVVAAPRTTRSVLSYRRGYDLDAVSTPLVTASGDMVSIPTLYLATFLVRIPWLNATVASVCIVVCLYATIRGALTDLPLARRAILEMTAVILLTPLLDILAGTVIEKRLDTFSALPGLLVIVPPLVSDAGALGGILSSRLASKLHLGVISPRGWPEAPAILDGSLVVGFGLVA